MSEANRAGQPGSWRQSRRLTGVLLLLWLAVTVLPVWYARQLAAAFPQGWLLAAILVAQCAPLAYLGITCVYARSANRLDEMAGEGEAPDER